MAKVEVRMPQMGESITEGTVVEWLKKPGDTVELDESLLEIGTDKVDTDVPSPSAGTVAEILIAEGETVEVGTVLALIETERVPGVTGDGVGAEPAGEEQAVDSEPELSSDGQPGDAPGEASGIASTPETASKKSSSSAAVSGDTIDVLMPKMGESITEGTVLTWLKGLGDSVALDEPLLEIATDKVDTDVPSPASGTLVKILVQEGETVDVMSHIAVIAIGDNVEISAGPALSATSSVPTQAAASTPSPLPVPAMDLSGESAHVPQFGDKDRFYSPLVRSIAEKEGLNQGELASIQGSGRDGRVTKKDVLSYLSRRGSAPLVPVQSKRQVLSPASPIPERQPGERVEIVEMDRMRRLIAEHMTRSKETSAHVTSFGEADVTSLVRLRERNKAAFYEREGVKLTYTPFFVYAAVEALREHAILNASVVENAIHYRKDYHIGIAVAIGDTGLVVPVIHDAGQKNLVGLAHAAADLADRSRNKKLLPDELQGGTFTVTNVGSLGSIMGTPILNQPQVGILATGVIRKRPVVIEDPNMGDMIGIRHMMYISLSYDHRVVDGAMGSSFLQKFVDVIESFDANEVIK